MNARSRPTASDDNFGRLCQARRSTLVWIGDGRVLYCGGAVSYAQTRNHVLPLQNHIHAYKFYFVCLVFFSFSAGSPRSFCSPMNTWLRCTLNAIWSRVLPENITTHISHFRSTTKLRSHSSHTHTHAASARYWYDKYLKNGQCERKSTSAAQ